MTSRTKTELERVLESLRHDATDVLCPVCRFTRLRVVRNGATLQLRCPACSATPDPQRPHSTA